MRHIQFPRPAQRSRPDPPRRARNRDACGQAQTVQKGGAALSLSGVADPKAQIATRRQRPPNRGEIIPMVLQAFKRQRVSGEAHFAPLPWAKTWMVLISCRPTRARAICAGANFFRRSGSTLQFPVPGCAAESRYRQPRCRRKPVVLLRACFPPCGLDKVERPTIQVVIKFMCSTRKLNREPRPACPLPAFPGPYGYRHPSSEYCRSRWSCLTPTCFGQSSSPSSSALILASAFSAILSTRRI